MMTEEEKGRYAYEGLDRLMHEKARLSIMITLYTRREGCVFNEIKKMCNLTDGNLSRHITILKEAGLLNVIKGYENNKPKTFCELTEMGREKFREYLEQLEQVVKDAEGEKKTSDNLIDTKRYSPA
ncbi:MAG: transcriptional regulator [Spirochaetales bacterium]|nr:transcriptional regulator [Spirochaetales bacterium]